MKKLLSFALAMLSILLLLTGCSGGDAPFTEKSYTTDGTQVREIHIDVRDREIEVSASKDNQIHISYKESSEESYHIELSDDHILTMTAVQNKEWTDYIGSKPAAADRKISLRLPDALLSSLTLSTTNENITLSSLTVTDALSVSANGGNITLDRVNAGSALTLTAKNGDITGTIVGSYDEFAIACKIKKGDSNLPAEKADGEKTLNVSNNNGDIELEFVRES